MNLASNLVSTAGTRPDAPALRVGDQTMSYRELLEQVQKTAGYLRERGVAPGGRIALILPNVPAFPISEG